MHLLTQVINYVNDDRKKKGKFAYQDSLPLVTMYQNISQFRVCPPLKKYMYGYFVSQIFV